MNRTDGHLSGCHLVRLLCSILLIFSISAPLQSSKPGVPFIKNYTPEDYGAHAQNFAIVQDQRGVLYFANAYGVLEFDGVFWNLIRIPNNSLVRSLAVNRHNEVLVGAVGEFGYLKTGTTTATQYVSLSSKIKKKPSFSNVWDTFSLKGNTYFCTSRAIFVFTEQGNLTIPANNIRDAFQIGDRIVFQDSDLGLLYLKNNRLIKLPECQLFERSSGYVVALPYDKDWFIIVSENRGCYLYSTDAFDIPVTELASKSGFLKKSFDKLDDYFKQYKAYKGIKLNENSYAFTTLKNGVLLTDKSGRINQIINKNSGLNSNTLVGIYSGTNGNLWVSSMKGISYITLNSPITQFNKLKGLDEIVISMKFHKDRFYVGAIDGVFVYSESDDNSDKQQGFFDMVSGTEVECFDFIDVNGNLFGSGRHSMFHIDGYRARKFTLPSFPYSFGKTKKFTEYFFCGMRDGLMAIKIKKAANKDLPGIQKVLLDFINDGGYKQISEIIRGISADHQGNIWLSTRYNGVIYLRFNSDDIRDFSVYRYSLEAGLPQKDWNRALMLDNEFVVVTYGGIYKPDKPLSDLDDPSKLKFVKYRKFGGLLDEHDIRPSVITKDSYGNYWIGSSSGLGVISKTENGSYRWETKKFKKIRGEIENIYEGPDRIIWISSHKPSLYRYDPAIVKNYGADFNTYIRKVIAGQDKLVYSGQHSPKSDQEGPISDTQEKLQLAKEDNSISFEFAAVYFDNTKEIKYNWFLEGFDTDWNGWRNEFKANYTNIPPGEYIFRVKSKNIYETEGREAKFRIVILTPWYLSIFAYLLYILILIGLFLIGIRLNSKRLIAAKDKLEKTVAARTFELEMRKTQIEESEEKYRTLVELANDSIAILKEDTFLYFNPTLPQILGYDESELAKMTVYDVIDPQHRGVFQTRLKEEVTDKEGIKDFESVLIDAKGKTREIIVSMRNIVVNNARAKMIFFHDISLRKKLEEETIKRSKLESIGLLAGGIAHDFNNLLAVIIGRLNIMKMSDDIKVHKSQIEIIENSASNASDLIKKFLTFSEGGITIKKNKYLKKSIYRIVKTVERNDPGLIKSTIPDNLFAVQCDREQIEMVIQNLLSNSIEATEGNGLIEISAQNIHLGDKEIGKLKSGDYIRIQIKDNGKGIPEHLLPKIFDPYFSTKNDVTQKGLGMGLSIVYSIIINHNGHIEVDSIEGEGTTVTFYLPASETDPD